MQLSTIQLALFVPLSIIALDYIRRLIQVRQERKGLPLPPGPSVVPLLGNVLGINLEEPWKTYTDWRARYGNVLYVRLLDQDVIVLGSQSDAVELLEKRSQLYSDRPFVATIEPFGGLNNFAFASYGDHWRFCRRIFHQTFRSEAALSFRPMQIRSARQLVLNMINDPDRYMYHYSTFSTVVALSAAYDYEPLPQHDPIVQIIEDFAAAGVPAVTPEKAILLKLFPFLLHIPDWFPGSSLKIAARHCYGLSEKLMDLPFQYAKQRMEMFHEHSTFSMVSDHLTRIQTRDESQRSEYIFCLKKAALSAIAASEETTTSSLMVFTLAMVLHPLVLKRAQAEIDTVVGTNRFPDFSDRPSLPYVEAIVRETVRWHPVLPLGLWHAVSSSDVYNGHYIPKGATVVANAWAMSRDEIRFPNAEAFIPERFINEDGGLNGNNPMDFVFGFGRRICPGRYTADASLWSAIVTMLAMFDFGLPRNAEGNEYSFQPKWLNGLTHRPDVFPCHISPRTHVNKLYVDSTF